MTDRARRPRDDASTTSALRATSGAWGERFASAASAPVDAAWLAALRVMFGLMITVSALRFLWFGWVARFFVEPRFYFKYWGFSWVEPLGASAMDALFWVLAGLGVLVAMGACFRVAAALLVLGFTYVQLIDVTTYLNHYYLVSLLGGLLALSPAGRTASVDAWLRPRIRRTRVQAGWHWLFRFQVGVVYTFAGLAKAHGDWLLHAQPLRIWLGSHTGMPVLGPLFRLEETAVLMSWGGFLFDTMVPWLLSFRRTRPYAYVALIGFHALVGMLFPIGMFPVIMIVAALVFFPPDWPRALLAPLRGARAASEAGTLPPRRIGRPALLIAGLYALVQLALPLRAFAYGGDVRWHEQGMRFSWRVMVREKNASITYKVYSKVTGQTWYVSPDRYLTAVQAREIAGQPDLILQLAHHIGAEFRRRARGPVAVTVEALVSLNGRPSAPLIDPRVDLTTVEDGLGRAAWILPAPAGTPPHTRPI
ncbi:MAG: HTTM domain-containing protein [Polyangiales bacterium]